jgi:O-acetyl-ADP-ribose deacetylase (regulator of RNase III)
LRAAYRRCFQVAREHGVKSIAFPAISCGVYGYPMREGAVIALSEAKEAAATGSFERILFVQYNAPAQQVYLDTAARLDIISASY